MKRFILSVLLCGAFLAPAVAAVHNVRDYGAKGDGVTIDSPAINAAIQAAANEGGGVVYLPAGRYASYSVRLAILISGIPGYRIEDVTVRNFHIQFQGGFSPADAPAPDAVPENEDKYPEMTMFGTIPAKGMYLRHVDGMEFDGIHFSFMKPDSRPLVIMDDVQNVKFNNITEEGRDVTATLKKGKGKKK